MAEQPKDELDFATVATNLTPSEKAEYLALVKMFESDGWKVLAEHLADVRDGAQITFNFAESWDTNRYYRGYIDAMTQVLAYEDAADRYYARLAASHIETTAPSQDDIEVEDREMI